VSQCAVKSDIGNGAVATHTDWLHLDRLQLATHPVRAPPSHHTY
jgi:hypothetical protein